MDLPWSYHGLTVDLPWTYRDVPVWLRLSSHTVPGALLAGSNMGDTTHIDLQVYICEIPFHHLFFTCSQPPVSISFISTSICVRFLLRSCSFARLAPRRPKRRSFHPSASPPKSATS